MESREICRRISQNAKKIKVLENMNGDENIKQLLVKDLKRKRQSLDGRLATIKKKFRLEKDLAEGQKVEIHSVEWRHFLVSTDELITD